jgi:hypothetical protein
MRPTPGTILLIIVLLLGYAVLILLTLGIGGNNRAVGWGAQVNGSVMDIVTGDNGTIYAFSSVTGNIITAFYDNGTREWEYHVSDAWRVRNVFAYADQLSPGGGSNTSLNDSPPEYWPAGFSYLQTKPVYAVDRGVLYVYVRENRTTYWNHGMNEDYPGRPQDGDWMLHERLLALAGNGSLLWDVPIRDEHHVYEDTSVIAKGGRIYVFDGYAVTILGDNGSVLFRIDNVSRSPAIDDNGNIYIVPAIMVDPQPQGLTRFYHDTGLKAPKNELEAYDARGKLLWRADVDGQVWLPGYNSLPIYQNDTLFVPVSKGIQAFNTNSSLRWAQEYVIPDWPIWGGSINLYSAMPVDSHGNAYMYEEGTGDPLASKKWYHIIAVNGSETIRENLPYATDADSRNGIIIATGENLMMNNVNIAPGSYPDVYGVPSVDLTAYDIPGNLTLWKQSITPETKTTILTIDNMDALLSQNMRYRNVSSGLFLVGINGQSPVSIIASDNFLFVAYTWASYNAPIVLNWTKCIYGSQVTVFDERMGTQLWETPLDALVTAVAARNDTVYYGTGEGRLFARQVSAD